MRFTFHLAPAPPWKKIVTKGQIPGAFSVSPRKRDDDSISDPLEAFGDLIVRVLRYKVIPARIGLLMAILCRFALFWSTASKQHHSFRICSRALVLDRVEATRAAHRSESYESETICPTVTSVVLLCVSSRIRALVAVVKWQTDAIRLIFFHFVYFLLNRKSWDSSCKE